MRHVQGSLSREFLEQVRALPEKEQKAYLRVCHYLAMSRPGYPLSFNQMDKLFEVAMHVQ